MDDFRRSSDPAKREPLFNIAVAILALAAVGCAARSSFDRDYISRSVEKRTGHPLSSASEAARQTLPPGVNLQDGIDEDEAVAMALWRNAEFLAALAELGFARAELADAGLFKNPLFSVLYPLGPKQLEFSLTQPFEALWQRPRKVLIARLRAEGVAERLVQSGVNLSAEVRQSHSQALHAAEVKVRVQQVAEIEAEIARITDARLRAGDISEMEWQAVRARALRSQQDAKAAARDETLALERLRQKLGLALEAVPLRVVSREASPAVAEDIGVLVKEALASRPDVRAAELELEAAGKRAGLERAQAISLSGILDANGEGREGFEAGPGLAAAIPFFNLNQSGMQRARAELEQASQNYFALRQRVATEVRIAAVRFRQAEESRRAYRQEILPALEEAQARAQRAYELGEVSYLEVLFSTRELLHARLQEAAHSAEVTQARAELERSVGRKL